MLVYLTYRPQGSDFWESREVEKDLWLLVMVLMLLISYYTISHSTFSVRHHKTSFEQSMLFGLSTVWCIRDEMLGIGINHVWPKISWCISRAILCNDHEIVFLRNRAAFGLHQPNRNQRRWTFVKGYWMICFSYPWNISWIIRIDRFVCVCVSVKWTILSHWSNRWHICPLLWTIYFYLTCWCAE